MKYRIQTVDIKNQADARFKKAKRRYEMYKIKLAKAKLEMKEAYAETEEGKRLESEKEEWQFYFDYKVSDESNKKSQHKIEHS